MNLLSKVDYIVPVVCLFTFALRSHIMSFVVSISYGLSCFDVRADSISSKYGYEVKYSGVGDPPQEHRHVGHCSQMAVFVRSDVDAAAATADSTESGLCPNTEYSQVSYKHSFAIVYHAGTH